jgi:adenine-specific DNA methylase
MDRNQTTIRVQCTCCEAVLTVDRATGEVVFTDKPKKKSVSFEEAVLKVKQESETAEDRFREAFQKEEGRMKLVDQKFEEAMKRKDELEMPIKPIDLD